MLTSMYNGREPSYCVQGIPVPLVSKFGSRLYFCKSTLLKQDVPYKLTDMEPQDFDFIKLFFLYRNVFQQQILCFCRPILYRKRLPSFPDLAGRSILAINELIRRRQAPAPT